MIKNLGEIISILKSEIDKYELIDLGPTPISKTKIKFNAEGLISIIDKYYDKGQNHEENNAEGAPYKPAISLREIAETTVKEGVTMPEIVRATELVSERKINESEKRIHE